MNQYTPEVRALIRAAQAACQSRNGSNTQATEAQHAKDLDALSATLEKVKA